ncbi:Non-specific lipid-transfer protein A [Linum grandiflorum]
MKGSVGVISMVVLVVTVVVAMPRVAAINCGQVDAYLAPCIPYLINGAAGGDPAPKCCEGVLNLKTNTPTVDERRAACACVKVAAGRYPVKDDAAASLPTKCGVSVSIPISKTIDCQRYLIIL